MTAGTEPARYFPLFPAAARESERARIMVRRYEEPAGPESSQTLRAMRERIPSDVAICVGERHYTRFGIRSLLEKHVLNNTVIQTDFAGYSDDLIGRMWSYAKLSGIKEYRG